MRLIRLIRLVAGEAVGLLLFILFVVLSVAGGDPGPHDTAASQARSDRYQAWADQCYDQDGPIPDCYPPGQP